MSKSNQEKTKDFIEASRPEPAKPDLQEMKELAIYLEGLIQGKGNILPLGKSHIDNLWYSIHYLTHYSK